MVYGKVRNIELSKVMQW